MFRLRFHIINACLAAFDLALSAVCLYEVARLDGPQMSAGHWADFLRPAGSLSVILFLVGWSTLLSICGLYQSRRVSSIFSDAPTLFKASSAGLFIAELISRFPAHPFFTPYFLPRFFAAALLVLVISRSLLRCLLRKLREMGLNAKSLLIVAAPGAGDRIAEIIARHDDFGYRSVQRLDYQSSSAQDNDAFIDEFRRRFKSHRIDDVILALPAGERTLEMACIKVCENHATNVRIVPDLLPMIQANSQLVSLGGIPLISVQPYRTEELPYIVGKRIFDLLVSALALIILSPLLFLISVLIKLTSDGPILVIQERVGLNARKFKMYKFRTMYCMPATEQETHWTRPGDPTVTPLGGWLRRSNLDELPQFLNVLKGDMSIVGPRPERPHFINLFQKEIPGYMGRHYAKCGITGWAQVNGWRGDTSIEQRVTHDLYYIRNWGFVFDLKIILLTLTRTFFHRNAY